MASKKFLFIVNRYLPCQSGAEVLTGQIAEKLSSMGHSVKVLTLNAMNDDDYVQRRSREPQKANINRVSVRRFKITRLPFHERVMKTAEELSVADWLTGRRAIFSIPMMKSLTKEIGESDVVISGVMPFTGIIYPALITAKRMKKRFVLLPLMHFGQVGLKSKMNDFEKQTIYPKEFRYEYFSETAMKIYRESDIILTQGLYEENFIKNNTKSFFARINPRIEIPEKFQSDHSGFTVFTLGNHNYHKGIEATLKAYNLLRKSKADVKLIISGRVGKEYEEQIKSTAGVEFMGQSDDKLKRECFMKSDVFLLPSIAESLGIAVLEAHSYGIPTIGAYCSGSMQLIKEGVNGYLVPFMDYRLTYELLMALYENASLLERLKSESRRIASEGDLSIDGYRDGPFDDSRQEKQIKTFLEMI
ncbi:MAG: glycosyltransferase family 4 protein [bacterium]